MKDLIVVITGASSGIGVATAYAFAQGRASIVLAARNEVRLRAVAEDCKRIGARVLPVPTDVTNETAVEELARRTFEEFGRLDVWVNNAAVTLFATLEESPIADFRRVLETNLYGYVYGARAALPYFRAQEAGILINVASIAAKVGQPYTSAYVVSKHAVRALGICLRQEFAGARNIHVCTVMPASIDTPLFQHAANYTGRAIQPIPPFYDAAAVARTIVDLAVHPKREVFVGGSGRLLNFFNTLFPGMTERLMRTSVERSHFKKDERAESTSGNLYKPMVLGYGISGGWKTPSRMRSRIMTPLSIGSVFAGLIIAWRWTKNRRAEQRTKLAA